MTQVQTHLRYTRESARRERFEPSGPIKQTNVQKAIEQVSTQPSSIIQTDITFSQSPYIVSSNDNFIAVNTSGGVITINLVASSSRNGVPLTIKDVSGNASTNNISIVASGSESVDSLSTYPIKVDFGGVRLIPRSGGYTVDA